MNAKLPDTPKAWVDPDEAPELDEAFFLPSHAFD